MQKKRCSRLLIAVLMLAAPLAGYGEAHGPRAKTAYGVVEGKREGAIRIYLGIPYAAPPVGELRWKPPLPPEKRSGIHKATEFGARCMQAPVYSDMIFRDSGGSEDCLYLNVWTPAKRSRSGLPVMVWIHGGGFVAGASSEPRQEGIHLARQGVVVVSMNYRLGMFGFFVHPQLAKESGRNSAGNYGLLDQVAALDWVHKNIAAFGGDPANVTIFGESAGSFSVSALMASPAARGLFQKAIGESGAAFSSKRLNFEPLAVREEKDAKLIAERLGRQTLADLRAMPAQKLLDVFGEKAGGEFSFGPDIDGYFLPESAPAIFAAGKQNDVPLLAGWNHDEGSFTVGADKPTAESLRATGEKEFGARADEFVRLYPAADEAQAWRSNEDFASDKIIAFSTWSWLEAQAKTGRQPEYRYRFDEAPPLDAKGPAVAYHSAEIEYVFGQLDSKAHVDWRGEDRQLSELMQKYWSNFARNGDPNGKGLPRWPAYSAGDGWEVMILDGKKSDAHKDDLRARYLFLLGEWGKWPR